MTMIFLYIIISINYIYEYIKTRSKPMFIFCRLCFVKLFFYNKPVNLVEKKLSAFQPTYTIMVQYPVHRVCAVREKKALLLVVGRNINGYSFKSIILVKYI